MNTFNKIMFVLCLLLAMGYGLTILNDRDDRLMEIEYCWDSQGEHYVAPNEMCTH